MARLTLLFALTAALLCSSFAAPASDSAAEGSADEDRNVSECKNIDKWILQKGLDYARHVVDIDTQIPHYVLQLVKCAGNLAPKNAAQCYINHGRDIQRDLQLRMFNADIQLIHLVQAMEQVPLQCVPAALGGK